MVHGAARAAALGLAAAALGLAATALGLACSTTCTDVPAQTRTLVLAARDASPDAIGTRPLGECRTLCGDTTPDDPSQSHVTACRLTINDAGDSVASCDETAYRLCPPEAR
jgi:hypothetical protein